MQIEAIRDIETHQILTNIQFYENELGANLPKTTFAELLGVCKVVCKYLSQMSETTGENISTKAFIDRLCEKLQEDKKNSCNNISSKQ